MISLVDITTENFPLYQTKVMAIEGASFPSPWSLRVFRDEINNPVSHLRALILNEELGGYICYWMFGGEIHLMNIAIHPEKRGRGLGHYLLSKMIEEGISEGFETVWLEVRPSNVRATSMYRNAGFKEIARRPLYYKDTNEDGIVMSLSLVGKDMDSQIFSGKNSPQLSLTGL